MSKNDPAMQPWQFFHVANKYLGPANVSKLFNREKRSAYNWAQNPLVTVHRCSNPLQLMHRLFSMLNEIGLGYAARSAIAYLQTAIDQDTELNVIKEPLPTITEEILADFSIVAELKLAIDDEQPIETISALAKEAEAEIQRTVARYIKDNG